MSHVQESLNQYQDLKLIKALVNRKNRLFEAEEDGSKKDVFKKKAGKDKGADKMNKEHLIDAKSTLSIITDNWKKFQMASKGDMSAYKGLWSSFANIKSILQKKGLNVKDVYRLFGSIQKGKDGRMIFNPGNFTVASIVGKGTPKIFILNHDKSLFDGKTILLEIPGEEGVKQFAELLNKIKISAKAAKDNYVSTTLRKKKDEIFSAMGKGSPKETPANTPGEVAESTESDNNKGGKKKKGNPNFKKGVKPDFSKKAE